MIGQRNTTPKERILDLWAQGLTGGQIGTKLRSEGYTTTDGSVYTYVSAARAEGDPRAAARIGSPPGRKQASKPIAAPATFKPSKDRPTPVLASPTTIVAVHGGGAVQLRKTVEGIASEVSYAVTYQPGGPASPVRVFNMPVEAAIRAFARYYWQMLRECG